jgi:hypothetical protein
MKNKKGDLRVAFFISEFLVILVQARIKLLNLFVDNELALNNQFN